MNYVSNLYKLYFLIFPIMSMSDSDHWASQIINELIEDIATFDRNASINIENIGSLWQNCNMNDESTNQESKTDRTMEESGTHRDYITGSPCKFDEESAILSLTNDISTINDVHSEESLEFEISEHNDHFISPATENDLKYVDKIKSDKIGNPMDTFDDATKNRSGDIIAEISDSSQIDTKEELTTFDNSNPFLTDTAEVNDGKSEIVECGNKKTDEKFTYLTIGLKSETEPSDEYLKRADDKVYSLGFKHHRGEDAASKRSSSLTGLYFKYFTENYIKEEMDYRWRFHSESYGEKKDDIDLLCQSDKLKKSESVDFKPTLEENIKATQRKGIEREEFDRKNVVINQEREKKIINNEYSPLKRKNRNILEEIDAEFENLYSESGHKYMANTENSTEHTLNNRLENNIFSLGSDDSAKNTSLERRTIICAPERNNCILLKEIFSPKFLRRKRRKLGHDGEDDLVIRKRIDKIITVYRTTCRVFEELFLRPSATIIVESIEFLLFLFFLGVCGLCIIYKGASLNSLKKNKDSFIDMFKRGNQTVKSSFSKLFFFTKGLGLKDGMNKSSLQNETSLVSISPKIHSNNIPRNKIQLNVEPDDVFVLNSVFEQVKQNLEDMYEKGDSYFESLNEDHRIATVASPDDDFVDIILKECTGGIEEPHSNRNECDIEVIASKKATCCTEHGSNESIANISCSFPRSLISSCYGENVSHCSKLRKRTISNESLLKEFNIDSDRMKGVVFNSTVVDDSESSTKAKSRNRSKFRLLSPSNKIMSESTSVISLTVTSSGIKTCSSSSMSVNLPSFRSRSELNLSADSPSLLNTSEKVSFENICTTDTLLKERDVTDVQDITPLVTQGKSCDASELIDSVTSTNSMSIPCVKKTEQCSESTEHFVAQTSQKFHDRFPVKSNFSDDFTNFENAGTENLHVCSLECGNSFSFDNPEFLSEPSTVNASNNDDLDSLMMHESSAICDSRISKGKKNSVNLRRRMSLIFNNWRNTNMMQCVTSNLKGRKKYKKQLNIVET